MNELVPEAIQQFASLVLTAANNPRYPEAAFRAEMCKVVRAMCEKHKELDSEFSARLKLTEEDSDDPKALGIMTILGALGSECSKNDVWSTELNGLALKACDELDRISEREIAEGLKLLHPSIPRIAPTGWVIERLWGKGAHYIRPLLRERNNILQCIFTADEVNGKMWLHLSVSTAARMPSWEEIVHVKEQFIGAEKKAVMVIPERSKYVNNHPFCMHLWHCLAGEMLPDFTALV